MTTFPKSGFVGPRRWGFIAVILCAFSARADWPMLKSYEGDYLQRISMPIGGIGTGTISLEGRGSLADWAICGHSGRGVVTKAGYTDTAFSIMTEEASGKRQLRILEGPYAPMLYEHHYQGCFNPSHGFPRFDSARFSHAYPLAQIEFEDAQLPVKVRLEAMNPIKRGDVRTSGMPLVMMRYRVTNTSSAPVKATVFTTMANPCAGKLTQESVASNGLRGVVFHGAKAAGDQFINGGWGEFAVCVPERAGKASAIQNVHYAAVDVWKIMREKGEFPDSHAKAGKGYDFGYVSVQVELKPGEAKSVPFILSWRFPNRRGWPIDNGLTDAAHNVGNWYATQWATAFDVATAFHANAESLERETMGFVKWVLAKKAPDVVKEAALANLSTLRGETCFRSADGHFFGFEGMTDKSGICAGTCTHVWGYEHALVDVWPEIAKDVTTLQFTDQMMTNGLICFRIGLPLAQARNAPNAAADGQMQCLVKAYENWRKTGDDAWMKSLYPNMKTALAFAWLPGGWDADEDGVMEGCQHNTLDCNWYGPNPLVEFLYLAALRAMARMAEANGDAAFAAKCADLGRRGAAWTEANLFNGSHYVQKVASGEGPWLKGTVHMEHSKDLKHPAAQLGDDCLIDQLLGDMASRLVGLGPVADGRNAHRTFDTILAKNRIEPNDKSHWTIQRSFALPGERSLRMSANGTIPYGQETMTGFEYAAATWLALVGRKAEAEEVVRDIRMRYDGRRRSPFNETECGFHYARALAAWNVLRAFDDE